jgi:hypothetical protein
MNGCKHEAIRHVAVGAAINARKPQVAAVFRKRRLLRFIGRIDEHIELVRLEYAVGRACFFVAAAFVVQLGNRLGLAFLVFDADFQYMALFVVRIL